VAGKTDLGFVEELDGDADCGSHDRGWFEVVMGSDGRVVGCRDGALRCAEICGRKLGSGRIVSCRDVVVAFAFASPER